MNIPMIKSSIKYRISFLVFVFFFVACITTPLCAGTTECPSQYLNGSAPDILIAQGAAKTHELCFDNFVVMHSGITMTPLWSAEHLTRSNLRNAKRLRRSNNFHAEDRLPVSERADLSDYSRSGYDRGHMSPNGDMPTEMAQWQSFSLSNIIPQDPDSNRHLWEGIEAAVRTFAKKTGELYVITGPLYLGDSVKRLNGRVLVPTNIFKIVFDPNRNMGAAYFVKNEPGNKLYVVSISQLEELAGINFFPNLSITIKQSMLELPEPAPYNNIHQRHYNSSGVSRPIFY